MTQAAIAKKELSPASAFPPGSVEATTFTLRRRRKLLAKDTGTFYFFKNMKVQD